MKYKGLVQKLYTSRILLYHVFIYLIGYARAVRLFFIRSAYLHDEMHILDAGCGSGLILKILHTISKKRNISIWLYGFDLTPAMLNRCKQWSKTTSLSSLFLKHADVLKIDTMLPSDWPTFDLITVSGMLEYVPKRRLPEALINLKNILSPHGTITIFICKKNWLTYWLIYRWWHAQTYTKKELITLATALNMDYTFKRFPRAYRYLDTCVHIIELKR